MAIAETVKNYLTQKAVDYTLPVHPHSGSSHETAEASHVREDHIAKGVIVKDASGYAMVVVPAPSSHFLIISIGFLHPFDRIDYFINRSLFLDRG